MCGIIQNWMWDAHRLHAVFPERYAVPQVNRTAVGASRRPRHSKRAIPEKMQCSTYIGGIKVGSSWSALNWAYKSSSLYAEDGDLGDQEHRTVPDNGKPRSPRGKSQRKMGDDGRFLW